MATLVSPGLDVQIIDESQYVGAGAGTTPFVVIATEQDKTTPSGALATGTTKANANKLLSVGSQREFIQTFGQPIFKTSFGTPLHGHELNEYGSLACYSALGLGGSAYVLRADIDLKQLEATGIRPTGDVEDGFMWLDLTNTTFGIYEWNQTSQTYTNKVPLVLNKSTDINPGSPVANPKVSVGEIGDYAVITLDPNNPVYYKNADNTWVPVGTRLWQQSLAAAQSSVPVYASAPVPDGTTITINTVSITLVATDGVTCTGADVVNSINLSFAANYGDGIRAVLSSTGRLTLRGDDRAMGNGVTADSRIVVAAGDGANALGLNTTASNKVYFAPLVNFGNYTQVPNFATGEATPAPTGSVWMKIGQIGNGAVFALKKFNATTKSWPTGIINIYEDNAAALYDLDVLNGGFGVAVGTIYVDFNTLTSYPGSFRLKRRYKSGATKIVGAVPASGAPFSIGNTFSLTVTQPGESTYTTYNFTITGTSVDDFIALILGAGIPNVFSSKEASGAIAITHKAGGDMILIDTTAGSGNPISDAGFSSTTSGITIDTGGAYAGGLRASNWQLLGITTGTTYVPSTDAPYIAPEDGTYWFFNDIVQADMMICDTDGWKGYRNVTSDARGYDLSLTDVNGPIFSAGVPVTQSSGDPLVPGDLWCDTSDLENYPKLHRWNGKKWLQMDNTDKFTQNGILFADARWDASTNGNGESVGGIIDPVAGSVPLIQVMLTSNYTDLDCPAYQLYPRGLIMWNTRRNGGNIKQYISDYFSPLSYPNNPDVPGVNLKGYIPEQKAAWVSASGNMDDGAPYMLRKAQRHMVVKALRAAIDSNTDIREAQYAFNLITCPNYYEVNANLIALNNDRAATAFIIGDTPLDLKPNNMDITYFSNNVAINASVYLALYYPAALTNDLSGNEVVQPASHIALRTYIYNDQVAYQWFAPAGARRGLVDNANNIGYLDRRTGLFNKIGVNQSLRDSLYLQRINPIANLPGLGLLVFGQKTRSPIPQATDRVNVSRLTNYIRSLLASISNSFLFEPNDKITRDQIKSVIEGAMNDLIAKRGVYDFLVVCDGSNNTRDRIARNELYVDIAVEPMKDVEFIYIPVRLKNPGTIGG